MACLWSRGVRLCRAVLKCGNLLNEGPLSSKFYETGLKATAARSLFIQWKTDLTCMIASWPAILNWLSGLRIQAQKPMRGQVCQQQLDIQQKLPSAIDYLFQSFLIIIRVRRKFSTVITYCSEEGETGVGGDRIKLMKWILIFDWRQ